MRLTAIGVCALLAVAGARAGPPEGGDTMRPHIFVTAEEVGPLQSVADLRHAAKAGPSAQVWDELLEAATRDLGADPLTPTSAIPGRSVTDVQHANRDYTICHAAGQRILRAALAALVTGERRWADDALLQMRTLLDENQWPDWRDMAHLRHKADLRTGMLSRDCALAYDWLYPMLSPEERAWIVEGIDRRGIQPFWRAIEEGSGWADSYSNWMTCIVGGLGIAGMALGPDHPDSDRLVEFSRPRMEAYLSKLGPNGEFNESVGYAGAMRLPVMYFIADWYATGGRENRLSQAPLPESCRWYMYLTLPPGRTAAFGDGSRGSPPDTAWISAVATATGDGMLQWFARSYLPRGPNRALPVEFLWWDDDLAPVSPEGRLPHGTVYRAHGACVSTRTDWDPEETPMVVYGKAGIERLHEHNDAGHVCIDAFGRQLIVDLGSPPGYPGDFFGANRYRYYNASSWGHNVLNFGDREMKGPKGSVAQVTGAEFDDRKGGWWQLDLTPLYSGVERVRRTVMHLGPAVAVVLDEARSETDEDIVLRWHTADACEPSADGAFTVNADGVHLSCRVVRLDGGALSVARGHHEYVEPFNRHRLGDLLEQRHESFVEARVHGRSCRLLTLFAAFRPEAPPAPWVERSDGWEVATGAGVARVAVNEPTLEATNPQTGARWHIPLSGF